MASQYLLLFNNREDFMRTSEHVKGRGEDALESRVWELIAILDAMLRFKKVPYCSVLYNKEYGAELSFGGGSNYWYLTSPIRTYVMHDVPLEFLLEKYARLMGTSFNLRVGDPVQYLTLGDYQEASQKYIQIHREELLNRFAECLEKALNSLDKNPGTNINYA